MSRRVVPIPAFAIIASLSVLPLAARAEPTAIVAPRPGPLAVRKASKITLPNKIVLWGAKFSMKATLLDASGSPVVGADVEFKFDGNSAGTAKTGSDGVAELEKNAYFPAIGPRKMSAHFAGNADLAPSKIEASLSVMRTETKVDHLNFIEKKTGPYWMDGNVIYVSDGGSVGPKQPCSVFINGNLVAEHLDLRSGMELPWNKLAEGENKIRVAFEGVEKGAPSEREEVFVRKKDVVMMLDGADVPGSVPANSEITVRMRVRYLAMDMMGKSKGVNVKLTETAPTAGWVGNNRVVGEKKSEMNAATDADGIATFKIPIGAAVYKRNAAGEHQVPYHLEFRVDDPKHRAEYRPDHSYKIGVAK